MKFKALKQEMSLVTILSLIARLIRRFLLSSVFGMVPIKRTRGSSFRTLRHVFDCKVAPGPRLLRIPKLRRFTWVFRRFDTPCSTSPGAAGLHTFCVVIRGGVGARYIPRGSVGLLAMFCIMERFFV